MTEGGNQTEYLFLIIHLLVILGFAAFILIISHSFGNRTEERDKVGPYECGMRPVGSPRQRYSMKFYIIAILFILFDIEVVFLFPWAINLRWMVEKTSMGAFGLVEMVLFLGILGLGLAYAWRKGALEWD